MDLGLLNSTVELNYEEGKEDKFKLLTNLWKFDRAFIGNYNAQSDALKQKQTIELIPNFSLAAGIRQSYDKLVVQTSIHVYGDEWIQANECGLTIPYILLHLDDLEAVDYESGIKYLMKGSPSFDYSFKPAVS